MATNINVRIMASSGAAHLRPKHAAARSASPRETERARAARAVTIMSGARAAHDAV